MAVASPEDVKEERTVKRPEDTSMKKFLSAKS